MMESQLINIEAISTLLIINCKVFKSIGIIYKYITLFNDVVEERNKEDKYAELQ